MCSDKQKNDSNLSLSVSSDLIVENMPDSYEVKDQKAFNKQIISSLKFKEVESEYKVILTIDGFSYKDISITINSKNVVSVRGKKETLLNNGTDVFKFERHYKIPPDFDNTSVKSFLSSTGVLTITAERKTDKKTQEDPGEVKHFRTKVTVSLYVGNFKKEEIDVKIVNGKLIIEGKSLKSEDHCEYHKITTTKKKFKRVYLIGFDVNEKNIRKEVIDGRLYVEIERLKEDKYKYIIE